MRWEALESVKTVANPNLPFRCWICVFLSMLFDMEHTNSIMQYFPMKNTQPYWVFHHHTAHFRRVFSFSLALYSMSEKCLILTRHERQDGRNQLMCFESNFQRCDWFIIQHRHTNTHTHRLNWANHTICVCVCLVEFSMECTHTHTHTNTDLTCLWHGLKWAWNAFTSAFNQY